MPNNQQAVLSSQLTVLRCAIAGLRVANLQPVSVLVRVQRAVPGRDVRPRVRIPLRNLPLRLRGREERLQDQGQDRQPLVSSGLGFEAVTSLLREEIKGEGH